MQFNILFFGTPQFALLVLEKLHENYNIVAVVTQPDKPVGRKQVLTAPPVKERALKLGLNVLQPEKASQVVNMVTERIDFIVTAAYGQYLPTKVLKMPFKFALNVHPSLLPAYRGATPMQSALLNGDLKTGVSIIEMVKEMDAGDLFMQQQFPLDPQIKYPELEKHCSELGAELLCKVIDNINSLSAQPQPSEGISHCTKISKQDGVVQWTKDSAQSLFNKLRAFTPWPGISTQFNNQKLTLLEFTAHQELDDDFQPGVVYRGEDEQQVLVKCSQGSIELHQVQLAGKNPTDIKAFLNGYSDFVGTQL